ncbi:competence protein ComA [Avibacterium avium]|uniref:competence protein ComA n=1 Tax=Avibacterium avium TaxID=751 RepID=UPI0039FD4F03
MINIKQKSYQKIQIGIWKSAQGYDCVCFDGQYQAQYLQLKSGLDSNKINQWVAQLFPDNNLKYLSFVTAIAPQNTWFKTLILPYPLKPNECEQQCRFLLSKELPIPLTEIWFDYASSVLKQGFKLDIFAIKKQIAKDYVSEYQTISIDVLDSAINSIIRAFEYLHQNELENDALLLYQDEQQSLAIQLHFQGMYFMQKIDTNLTALYQDFCQRYHLTPKKVYVLSQSQQFEDCSPDWVKINTDIPIIALGNALWKQLFYKNQFASL